ncbi:YybH family protein [Phenylobacterium montanum]|uniref:SgcJ/EcaC family oxidoreductase n=1 Tax=Phenylobacterium montanum TaxID=2823693 RepID=A0A975G4I1_9CAUL|nr:SgcJ/EcaC family oxidoreductase [Caulobacter sp. S6]QUD89891.1 SgcJ/EcaC family oxidoreductase [Caulobacter sp. S6]
MRGGWLAMAAGAAMALAAGWAAAQGTPAPAASGTAQAAKPAAAAPKGPSASGPSDRAQIQALLKAYNKAFNAKDADGVMAAYAKKGLFVFDVSPPREHVGWDDYKKDWTEMFAAFPGPLTNTISEQTLNIVGPVAWGHNVQDTSFTAKDGSKTEVTVRVTDVFRKTGGAWRIVEEHVSVPVDLATGKADLMSKP